MKILYFAVILFVFSCHKQKNNNNNDKGCSCDTDSVISHVTYNNFLGSDYEGNLNYSINNNNEGAWYISIHIININHYGISKICNNDLPAIRAFTDTSSRKYSIPVKVAGSLKRLCANEPYNFSFNTLPETVFFYIKIDSLKKQ